MKIRAKKDRDLLAKMVLGARVPVGPVGQRQTGDQFQVVTGASSGLSNWRDFLLEKIDDIQPCLWTGEQIKSLVRHLYNEYCNQGKRRGVEKPAGMSLSVT